jgi:hypothetical protein
MVGNGLGITLLPELAIGAAILSGTTIAILPAIGQARAEKLVWSGAARPRGNAGAALWALLKLRYVRDGTKKNTSS